MAIYITDDCRADFSKFSTKRFSKQKERNRGDYVISLCLPQSMIDANFKGDYEPDFSQSTLIVFCRIH